MNKPETNSQHDALQNILLSALPASEFENIATALECVELEVGEVLWESEETNKHVYFPVTALICLLCESEEGVSIEVGITGRNGLIGVPTYMGDPRMASRAVVFRAGTAYRMKAAAVKDEFSNCGDFQDMMMSYTQTLIAQISQSSICNGLHTVEQQLCRFLLIAHDHQQSDAIDETDTILLTQNQMASVLGVRRESVSIAAANLRDTGVIDYSRGEIRLLDRKRLETAACECYAIETEQYDRILAKYIQKHGA